MLAVYAGRSVQCDVIINEEMAHRHDMSQVQGGGLRDSFLVDGVAFKKTFSYAGFEMQPKSYKDPKVLLLNIELELKSEKENAEVRSYCTALARMDVCVSCMRILRDAC